MRNFEILLFNSGTNTCMAAPVKGFGEFTRKCGWNRGNSSKELVMVYRFEKETMNKTPITKSRTERNHIDRYSDLIYNHIN